MGWAVTQIYLQAQHFFFLGSNAYAICMNGDQNDFVGPSTPTEDFLTHPDGTAIHLVTGLMWKRCAEGQTWNSGSCTESGWASMFTWMSALQHAHAESAFAGYDDWRLPNIKELGTIVEISCSAPAINAAVFPGAPGGLFWSSSPNFSDSGKAWPIQFTHGISYPAEKSSMASVRLVRSVGGN